MKKKILALILGTTLIASMCLTGCGSDKTDKLYDYNLEEYITVGEYKGIEVDAINVEITSEEIDTEIDKRLKAASTEIEVLEGTVAMGDKINIDYVGSIDGEEFAGGSTMGNGTLITVGQAGYIDGFEDGLVGMEIGETKVLDLKFPEAYHNTDLAGKACQFEVTINKKLESVTPSYDLEFVKANSDCNSLNEYEQMVYEELFGQAVQKAEDAQKAQAWTQIVESSTVIKYPEKEYEEVKTNYVNYITNYVSQFGYTLEQYLETMEKTQEEFDEDMAEYVDSVVKNEMVLYQIAQLENIEITDEEYKEGMLELLNSQGFESDADFKKVNGISFEEAMGKEGIMTTLLLEEVMDIIMENAIIK